MKGVTLYYLFMKYFHNLDANLGFTLHCFKLYGRLVSYMQSYFKLSFYNGDLGNLHINLGTYFKLYIIW